MMLNQNQLRRRQHGATMVVALIMLVLLTLFALSAMNASNTGLKIASNTQTRAEVAAAVQQEIDKATSVPFPLAPASVAGAKPVDINNDGAVDYTVTVDLPVCRSFVPIKNSELKTSKAANPLGYLEDQKCSFNPDGTTINSLCSNTRWEIGANATDPISGASVSIHQGIGVRVATTDC